MPKKWQKGSDALDSKAAAVVQLQQVMQFMWLVEVTAFQYNPLSYIYNNNNNDDIFLILWPMKDYLFKKDFGGTHFSGKDCDYIEADKGKMWWLM